MKLSKKMNYGFREFKKVENGGKKLEKFEVEAGLQGFMEMVKEKSEEQNLEGFVKSKRFFNW